MPNPPRAPTFPTLPRLPALPRPRLARPRPSASIALDGREVTPRGEPTLPLPPYMAWRDFRPWLADEWQEGEHVAIVGSTGSGKTTFARSILKLRDFVVVLGTKSRDPSLYAPLEADGFVRTEHWTPWEWEDTGQRYIIFAPELKLSDDPSGKDVDRALDAQAQAFRRALVQIFKVGGWTVYADELRYLADDLRLTPELNLLYLQGRSLGVTMVASTQRPRAVPLNMFEQASWFYLWRVSDREDRRRASEMTGPLAGLVFETAARLPRHEFVAVNKVTDAIVRSRVAA